MKPRKESDSKNQILVRTALRCGWNKCDELYWQEWDRISLLKETTTDKAARAFWTGLNTGLTTGYNKCQDRLG